MAILLFILRLIGWVLLAVLLLPLIALLLPLGLHFAYQPGNLQVALRYGPLRFTLWPRGSGDKAAAPSKKPADTTTQAAPSAVSKTVSGDKADVTIKVKSDSAPAAESASQSASAPGTASSTPPVSEPDAAAEKEKASGGLPFGISDHIDAALQLLSDDPMAFAKCMLGHTGWLGRQLLRSIRIHHLDIFWTAHAEEASATAELYGAEMSLFNNLLVFVQQHVRLQSDRLWLEPDFTGQRTGERNVSFELTSCAAVLLWLVLRLLHRLWKDPQLMPAASKS